MSAPARAVGAFNPTAPQPGFLQPVLTIEGGDNRSFVQIFAAPERVDAFHPVEWPERDFCPVPDHPEVVIGGPSLWGFQFPDEEPIFAHWPQFRDLMHSRLDDDWLKLQPFLLFDIVDTLDLEDAKHRVYTDAYRAYQRLNREGAERWRDRAILEPALERAWRGGGLLRAGDRIGTPPPSFRARVEKEQIRILDDGELSAGQQLGLQQAYESLTRRFPELFPANGLIVSAPRPKRNAAPFVAAPRLRIVLAGSISGGGPFARSWLSRDVDIVDIAHFRPAPLEPEPELTIILGAHREWQALAEVGRQMLDCSAIIVTLATSAAPLVSDLDFQKETDLPTINYFAPYATSQKLGRDPVKTIQPLIDIILREMEDLGDFDISRMLLSLHYMLVREPLWADQQLAEANCRLGARALKAGAQLGGHGRLYTQGVLPASWPSPSKFELGQLFPMIEQIPEPLDGRRGTLLLLVERQPPSVLGAHHDDMHEGIERLFAMRGWRVGDSDGGSFEVEEEQRRFRVLIADGPKDVPAEEREAIAPGLTRAPLLVIHTHPRREAMLVGNRGQFFHAAVEDIALMEPGTTWVWPIVRRQLLERGGSTSQAALRLSAALAVEAIRSHHIDGLIEVDWARVEELLSAPDCERFVSFERLSREGAMLLVHARDSKRGKGPRTVLELDVEQSGPAIRIIAAD